MDLPEASIDVVPDSALQKSGKPFFVPDFAREFRFRVFVAVRVCRLGKNITRKFASRYYDAVGICLSIEAADMLVSLQSKGLPWALATAFDGSVILGEVFPVESTGLHGNSIEVFSDEEKVESIALKEANADFDGIIEYVSKYFTLKIGDYILVECGVKAHSIHIGGHVKALFGTQESVNVKIK